MYNIYKKYGGLRQNNKTYNISKEKNIFLTVASKQQQQFTVFELAFQLTLASNS